MKTIYNKIAFLICSFFILPFLGGGEINAQSEVLLNETWNFIEGNINGEVLQLPANFGNGFEDYLLSEDPFFEFFYSNSTSQCYGFIITYFDISNSEFYLDEIIDIQTNTCQGGDVLDFMDKHNSFFVHLPIDTNGTPKNPFNYTIVNGNPAELTITNSEGDWVKYGGVILSNTTFHQNSFTIYPNPVKEVLQVNNSSHQSVTAIIYDINGKKLQTHTLENNLSTIHVKALKQGMYFVIFESGTGERVSKRFMKK